MNVLIYNRNKWKYNLNILFCANILKMIFLIVKTLKIKNKVFKIKNDTLGEMDLLNQKIKINLKVNRIVPKIFYPLIVTKTGPD